VLQAAIGDHGDDRCALVTSLEGALLNAARWDLGKRPVTRALLQQLRARAERGEKLDPQVHANLAIELLAAGTDRERAVRHAREAVSVLVFAGLGDEAAADAQAWLRLAQQRGWPLASAVAASVAALAAQHGGDVSQALAYGQQAVASGGGSWISSIATAFMIPALIDRGAIEQARAMLADRHLRPGPDVAV
jgi:hypothetical protein